MPTDTFYALKEEKRQRIYNAALEEFNSAPYEEVTIQAIIRRAEIPRGSFYQYFTDKDDLTVYCLVESSRKSIDVIYKNNMDFILKRIYADSPAKIETADWFQKAMAERKEQLSDAEFLFQDKTILSIPLRLQRSAACEHANLYYPKFCRFLEAEGLILPEHIKMIAFYISMSDHLYKEYAYMNNLELNELAHREESMSAIFTPLRILLDTLRPQGAPVEECPANPDFSDTNVSNKTFAKEGLKTLTATLMELNLFDVRLLSADGLNLTLPLLPQSKWTLRGDTLSVPVDITRITGTVKMTLGAESAPTSANAQSAQENRLIFKLTEHTTSAVVVSYTVPWKSNAINLPAKNVTVLGSTRSRKKICLIDDGEIYL